MLVTASHLRKHYGPRPVVRGIDLTIHRAEILAVVGPNGSGKTTTIEMLLGVRSRDGGDVTWAPAARRRVGVQLQTAPAFPGLPCRDNLVLVARFHGATLSRAQAGAILARCGLAEVAGVDPARLSGGQLKRLAIAMALVNAPELVVLDEPTAALDPRGQREVHDLIAELARGGTAVLFTSHDMAEVAGLAHRVIVVDQGRAVAAGTPAELLAAHGVTNLLELYLVLTSNPNPDLR